MNAIGAGVAVGFLLMFGGLVYELIPPKYDPCSTADRLKIVVIQDQAGVQEAYQEFSNDTFEFGAQFGLTPEHTKLSQLRQADELGITWSKKVLSDDQKRFADTKAACQIERSKYK